MLTMLQYRMCCLSTFVKAILMLCDIRCIAWTWSWEHSCQWHLRNLFGWHSDWRGWSQSPCTLNEIFCNCARKLPNRLLTGSIRSCLHFIFVWKNLFRGTGKLCEFYFIICKHSGQGLFILSVLLNMLIIRLLKMFAPRGLWSVVE